MRTLLGVCALALRMIRPSRGLHRVSRRDQWEWSAPSGDGQRPRPAAARRTPPAAPSRVRPNAARVPLATALPPRPDLPWAPRVPTEDSLPQPAMIRPYLLAHEERERARARAARVQRPGSDLLMAEAS